MKGKTYAENLATYNNLKKLYNPYTERQHKEFIAALEEACALGFPIDFKKEGSPETLLNYIVEFGRGLKKYILPSIQKILDLGANIENSNSLGYTPLMCSCTEESFSVHIFMLLFRNGANINAAYKNGATCFQKFIVEVTPGIDEDGEDINLPALIQEMLQKVSDVNNRNTEDNSTALGWLCSEYKFADEEYRAILKRAIRVILKAGADPYLDKCWLENDDSQELLYDHILDTVKSPKDITDAISELNKYVIYCIEQEDNIKSIASADYEYDI